MPEYELRPIEAGELDTFIHAVGEGFQDDITDAEIELWRRASEPERAQAVYLGGEIVATSAVETFELTVPGHVVAMAGVTAVTVQPDHRRRGLLDRMMRSHLQRLHDDDGEPVATLWSSEAGIYGRWGFGHATNVADLTVDSREAELRRPPPEPRPRSLATSDARDALVAVHDAVRPTRPGFISRDAAGWSNELSDLEKHRDGAGRLRALVQDDAGGAPAGYALFRVRRRDEDGLAAGVVEVQELLATTPDSAAGLWDHLLRLSLTRTVHWEMAAEDEALPHMLTDGRRACRMRIDDALYVRLVDLPRALAERRYSAPVDVVLDVADDVCPWNAGRWRLAGDARRATCQRTTAAPDLVLGVTELGAAYLGGTSLAVLGAAGRVQERTVGALTAVSAAFRGARAPWCAEMF